MTPARINCRSRLAPSGMARLPGWREDVAHAVVLVGLTSDIAIIHDPARDSGPDEIGLDALLLAWSEMDYYCATIVRA